jgi:hypothetical protein
MNLVKMKVMNRKITAWLTCITFTSSLLVAVVPLPSLALTAREPRPQAESELYLAQVKTYKVRLGDTLSGIAYKNGISLQQLLVYNPSLRSNPHLIRVGQVIYLNQRTTATSSPPRKTRRQSVQAFNLPTQRRIGSSRSGARRGNPQQECRTNTNDELRVLLPETNFGESLQDYPTFFWYMPELKTQAEHLEFKIKPVNADGFETYEFTSTNQKAGIMNLTLPAQLGPLKEGQEYQWEVRIYCTKDTFIFAGGYIKRMSTEQPELTGKLENAQVEDYPSILAEYGIWYDALSILAGLRADEPTDTSLITDWENILKMIGFENISAMPLLATGDSQ